MSSTGSTSPPTSSSASPSWAQSPLTPATVRDKLIEHAQYVRRCGEDLPEVRDWAWTAT